MNLLGGYGLEAPLAKNAKCASDVKAMGFDGVSVISRTANKWVLPPDATTFNLPWPYDGKKWDMSQQNNDYFKEFKNFLISYASLGLAVFYKFQSSYFRNSWNKFPIMKQKSHPFVNNNYGVILDKPEEMMSSITFAPVKYHWLKWDIVSEPQNKFNFSPANQFGAAIMKAYLRQIKIIADVKKQFPSWVFGYAPNNEEECGGAGDRSEIHSWFHDRFKAVGLDVDVPGFYRVVNRQGDAASTQHVHMDCGKKWGVQFGLQATHELHVDGAFDPILAGKVKGRTLASGDGAPEDATFIKRMQELCQAGYQIFDAKYWEGINGLTPVAPYKWMVNWNRAAQYHEEIIHPK